MNKMGGGGHNSRSFACETLDVRVTPARDSATMRCGAMMERVSGVMTPPYEYLYSGLTFDCSRNADKSLRYHEHQLASVSARRRGRRGPVPPSVSSRAARWWSRRKIPPKMMAATARAPARRPAAHQKWGGDGEEKTHDKRYRAWAILFPESSDRHRPSSLSYPAHRYRLLLTATPLLHFPWPTTP